MLEAIQLRGLHCNRIALAVAGGKDAVRIQSARHALGRGVLWAHRRAVNAETAVDEPLVVVIFILRIGQSPPGLAVGDRVGPACKCSWLANLAHIKLLQ